LGAQAHATIEVWKRLVTMRLPRFSVRAKIDANFSQGRAFAARFAGSLPLRTVRCIADFDGLVTAGWFSRRWRVIRHGFWKIGAVRNLVWFAKV
jgi:hypothetical protein